MAIYTKIYTYQHFSLYGSYTSCDGHTPLFIKDTISWVSMHQWEVHGQDVLLGSLSDTHISGEVGHMLLKSFEPIVPGVVHRYLHFFS